MKTLKNSLQTTADRLSKTTKSLDNDIRGTRAWRTLRQSILERDRYTCKHCNIITHSLEVDHINTDPTNNNPINLQTLCKPCHLKKTTEENTAGASYSEHTARLQDMISSKNPITKY